MVFGYSTNAYTEYRLDEAIERIARLGFKGVEIMCDQPHLYPPEYGDADLIRLKNTIDRHALKVTNLNSFTLFAVGDTYLPSWIEAEKDRREIRIRHTLACLDIAKALGCNTISVPPGGPLDGIQRETAISLFYQGLERVIPKAETLGVKILIEPEPGLLMENTPEFLSFIKEIRSDMVGINFDIGHFFCAGEDPSEAFETLFKWIGHVHLEDIGPERTHNHLIAGQGVIGFSEIFKTMKRLGYSSDMSLELYPYTHMPDAAGQESLEHLRPIFKEAGLDIDR